jgi:pimeloyl-ACP methyl ester carboxylesterase
MSKDAAGPRLAYERRGSGPPLVLLHGIGHSRQGWTPIVDLLTPHRELVLIDLPGHGDSPLPAGGGPLGVAELTDQVQAFLRQLRLDRPRVAGNSLGGAIALELARRGVASAAVALAPIGFWSQAEVWYALMVLRTSRLLARLLLPVLRPALAPAPVRAAVLGIYFARPLRLTLAQAEATVRGFAAAAGVGAILPYSRRYRFRRGEELDGVPVTVAWGDHDRLLVGGQARRARALLPAARHLRLAGCGHVPMSDDPLGVAEVLLTA